MEQSLQKELLQETDYSKYLEELKTYYNLKKTYTKTRETMINKLINSKDSIEAKKKLFSKQKYINFPLTLISIILIGNSDKSCSYPFGFLLRYLPVL